MSDTREFTLPKGERARALELAMRALNALPLNRAWRVRCSVLRNERSEQQNRYLFGLVYQMLSEHTGFECEELHEWFLGSHFGWIEKKIPKRPSNPQGFISVPARTTTRDENGERDVLDWKRFSDFVAFIQRFAAQKLGVLIPDPDPDWRDRK